ncbi:MAG: hypothetical protein KIT17_17260 [Rubrivivax sp.]|nr:hypothetical protein [Rubrivivax sp.]
MLAVVSTSSSESSASARARVGASGRRVPAAGQAARDGGAHLARLGQRRELDDDRAVSEDRAAAAT